MEKTIAYYNTQSKDFIDHTIHADMSEVQEAFQAYVPKGSRILDFGCGSGRDAKYFLERGYEVTPIDGSAVLCKITSKFLGIPVKHMYFQELSEKESYDGIWACASILHLPRTELRNVFRKMTDAVKINGIIYCSFKYGVFEGERGGRYFTDMTEESFGEFLKEYPEVTIEKQWITEDVRPGRGDEKWLNLIMRKRNGLGNRREATGTLLNQKLRP